MSILTQFELSNMGWLFYLRKKYTLLKMVKEIHQLITRFLMELVSPKCIKSTQISSKCLLHIASCDKYIAQWKYSSFADKCLLSSDIRYPPVSATRLIATSLENEIPNTNYVMNVKHSLSGIKDFTLYGFSMSLGRKLCNCN